MTGSLEEAQAHTLGREPVWLVEKGVLVSEPKPGDEAYEALKDLLPDDHVYRIGTLEECCKPDPRSGHFNWYLVDVTTGEIQAAACDNS